MPVRLLFATVVAVNKNFSDFYDDCNFYHICQSIPYNHLRNIFNNCDRL